MDMKFSISNFSDLQLLKAVPYNQVLLTPEKILVLNTIHTNYISYPTLYITVPIYMIKCKQASIKATQKIHSPVFMRSHYWPRYYISNFKVCLIEFFALSDFPMGQPTIPCLVVLTIDTIIMI